MYARAITAAGIALLASTAVSAQDPPVLPPGYRATVFHQDFSIGPFTGLAKDKAGDIFVVSQLGIVQRLVDADDDGAAEVVETVWDGTDVDPTATGILWGGKSLFISHLGRISRIADTNFDGDLDTLTDLITDLPWGWHQNNALFTDSSMSRVFFGVGSTSDHSLDPDPFAATLLSYDPSNGSITVRANGLRNVYDGAVHPVTGDILVGDNGPNAIAQLQSPLDEVNLIGSGRAHYGHPYNWGPTNEPGFRSPLIPIPPHTAPTGMVFHENVGMSGYRNEAVMTAFGNDSSIVKLPLIYGQNDVRTWYSPFASGFTTLMDVVFDDEGAMYVAELATSRIWRIEQIGGARIIIEGQPSVGNSVQITIEAPDSPAHFAYPAASTGLAAIPFNLGGPGLDIHIDALSPVFIMSTTPAAGTGVFEFPQPTVLDGQGRATITVNIPNVPALVGYSLQLQSSVWDPFTILPVDVSPPQPMRILGKF